MPTAEADSAVRTLLEAITSPMPLDAGRNLFLGPAGLPSAHKVQKAVFVLSTGGTMFRLVGSTQDLRYSTVQITIRADASDYEGGLDLARACVAACQGPVPLPSGYTECHVDGEPTYVQRDAAGRHQWSVNVRLIRVG